MKIELEVKREPHNIRIIDLCYDYFSIGSDQNVWSVEKVTPRLRCVYRKYRFNYKVNHLKLY